MKKVLIITYLYYASRRISGLARYLPEFGWQPIILTPPLHQKIDLELRIVETPYHDVSSFWKRLLRVNPDEDIRRQVKKRLGITSRKSLMDFILTLGGEVSNYPDSKKGWKPFAISQGRKLLQEENIDVIISSSAPVTSHLIANELKIRYEIPWLAELRDLWTQNHYYYYGPVRKFFDKRLELKTLSKADALVTVSQPWAEKLRALHKEKLVYTITHGFDAEEVNDPPANLTTKFTITYTGFVQPRLDPAKLFAALKDLIIDKVIDSSQIEVRFYGAKESWLSREIEQYGLSSIVNQYGVMPRQIALEKQRESQLLLLLKWEDPQERGVYTGKIFEYLAARRPILATGGSDDVVYQLLDETKAGIYAPTVEDIKNTLKELYRQYKLTGEVAYGGERSEIYKYSHREMARKFSEILNHLARK